MVQKKKYRRQIELEIVKRLNNRAVCCGDPLDPQCLLKCT